LIGLSFLLFLAGLELEVERALIRPGNNVALVAAGLVSVIAFPITASALRRHKLVDTATQRGARWAIASRSPDETQSVP
jgi:Kef-type K+ transport system membrane component KefB